MEPTERTPSTTSETKGRGNGGIKEGWKEKRVETRPVV